jgi:hypothetical protein
MIGNVRVGMRPFLVSLSLNRRKTGKKSLDVSNAPVNIDRISPDLLGNVFDSWKEEMKTNGPPRERSRYPGM